MRLLEAIVTANHRAVAGDSSAGLHPAEFADSLPLVALTCIDVRLNPLLPSVLGIPEDQFIWLRNAGNIITSPLSSTMRSLALACAVKGGREIAIIGHTDCQVSKCTAFNLLERLKELGIERSRLPDNVNEFFGMFSSERQNVIKAVGFVRSSPIIGSGIPVHGLMVDVETGKLEWLVNGYESLGHNLESLKEQALEALGKAIGIPAELGEFKLGELKFPEVKIGEFTVNPHQHPSGPASSPPQESKPTVAEAFMQAFKPTIVNQGHQVPAEPSVQAPPPVPPRVVPPPPLRPKPLLKKFKK